ncbi:MAG: bifunctional phosphoribosylaminoimidazolecarboxamide formyltransferase/IMP cyclohydrolase, partial [Nitrospirae bacterium]|nr:bifunctional phosphoribosylaminoimidazolecarboxamide formyltransferase/IMP cyclohydrolase [Fimbriimonadaceae bacterium]
MGDHRRFCNLRARWRRRGASLRRWALFSVTDKRGAVELARALSADGLGLLSTGGTARALREAGLEVRDVAEHTGFPEIMDGRVKTLHPRIHGGLLAIRSNEGHMTVMASHGLEPIDVVVVNLYPFEETVRSGADFETCIENIDIGGPSMVRAAAKNHGDVLVLVDPADYEESLKRRDDPEFRRRMAAKAFRHTAYYDSMVARYLTSKTGENPYQETLTVGGRRALALRYGENP